MGKVADWLTYRLRDERQNQKEQPAHAVPSRAKDGGAFTSPLAKIGIACDRLSSQRSAANPDVAAGGEPPARTDPVGVPTTTPEAAAAANNDAAAGTPTDTHSAPAYESTSADMYGTSAAAAMTSAPVAPAAVTSAAARLEHCRWQEKTGGDGAHQKRSAKHDYLHRERLRRNV
jgi:hypothetical protein